MSVYEGKLQVYLDHHASSYDLYRNNYIVLNDNNVDKLFDEWKLCNYYNFIVEDPQQKLFDDEEIMRKLIEEDGYVFKFASERLKNDREFVKYAVSKLGILIALDENVPHDLCDIKYASPLEFTPERFRDDEEIVLLAADEDPEALQSASQRLKNDRDFVLKIINIQALSLKYAAPKFCNDREVVKLASHYMAGIHYAFYSRDLEERLRDNPDKRAGDFFYADYSNSPGDCMFQYASDELKSDREFVLDLIKINSIVFEYISEELQKDREVVLTAVAHGTGLHKVCDDVLYRTNSNNQSFYLDEKFKDDLEIINLALKNSGYNFQFLSEQYRDDYDLFMLAVASHPAAFLYASKRLQQMKSVVIATISAFNCIYHFQNLLFERFLDENLINLDFFEDAEVIEVCRRKWTELDVGDRSSIFKNRWERSDEENEQRHLSDPRIECINSWGIDHFGKTIYH